MCRPLKYARLGPDMLRFRRKEASDENPIKRLLGATLGSVVLFLLEVLQIGLIAGVIIFSVRTFLVKPFVVQGASMEPNFYDNEYLIVNQTQREYRRGDTVVFHPPANPEQFYIKRVIALPGEVVELKDGVLTIFNDQHPNGFILNESYITEFTSGRERVTVGLDEYYLLGDNRDESLDSRSFGPVNIDAIVGRAWIRGLPAKRAGIIERPIYTY